MKKRYQVSLTPEYVEQFQTLAGRLGIPKSAMSNGFDDYLKQIIPVMQMALDKGALTLTDMFHLIADQVNNFDSNQNIKEGKNDKKKVTSKASPKAHK